MEPFNTEVFKQPTNLRVSCPHVENMRGDGLDHVGLWVIRVTHAAEGESATADIVMCASCAASNVKDGLFSGDEVQACSRYEILTDETMIKSLRSDPSGAEATALTERGRQIKQAALS